MQDIYILSLVPPTVTHVVVGVINNLFIDIKDMLEYEHTDPLNSCWFLQGCTLAWLWATSTDRTQLKIYNINSLRVEALGVSLVYDQALEKTGTAGLNIGMPTETESIPLLFTSWCLSCYIQWPVSCNLCHPVTMWEMSSRGSSRDGETMCHTAFCQKPSQSCD